MKSIDLSVYRYGGEDHGLRFSIDYPLKRFETTLMDESGGVLVRSRLDYAYDSHFYMLFHGLAKSAKHCLRSFAPHVQREVHFGPCTSIIWGAKPYHDPFIHDVLLYLDRQQEPYACDQIYITLTQRELIRFRDFFEEAGRELERLVREKW